MILLSQSIALKLFITPDQSIPIASALFMIVLRAPLVAAAKKGSNLNNASTAAINIGLPGVEEEAVAEALYLFYGYSWQRGGYIRMQYDMKSQQGSMNGHTSMIG